MKHYKLGEIPPSVYDTVSNYMRNLHHGLAGANNRQDGRHERTVETEIRKRKLPPGGLVACMKPIEKLMPWIESLTAESFKDQDVYLKFIKALYSSIYAYNPTGKCIYNKCL